MKCKYFLFLLCGLMSFHSFAWWDTGHMLVARIAYLNLKPQTQAKVDGLTQLITRDYPEIVSFTDMAVWPDLLRKQSIDTFTHWHYIDVPLAADSTQPKVIVDTDNALWAMQHIKTIFHSDTVKPIEHARFLAFLVHIVGDLHQPLHTVSRSSKAHPEGDQGGNLFYVLNPQNEGQTISLHTLWDSFFGQYNGADEGQITELAQMISSKYPETYFEQRAQELDPVQWSNEGFNLAQNWVYRTKEYEAPTTEYQNKSQEIIKQQIALAGYRLARLIELCMIDLK